MKPTNKSNIYRVTVEKLNSDEQAVLQFEAEDREDIFAIVEKLKQNSGLDDKTSTQVGVALRLLGTVMMANRKHSLFSDFMPHFKDFMINLKTAMKNS